MTIKYVDGWAYNTESECSWCGEPFKGEAVVLAFKNSAFHSPRVVHKVCKPGIENSPKYLKFNGY